MATTYQDFSGFALTFSDAAKGVLDADHRPGVAATGNCSVSAIGLALGVKIAEGGFTAYYRAGGFHTFTPGSQVMMGAYVQLDDTNFPPVAASPMTQLLASHDESEAPWWYIRVDDAGDFELYDSANNLLATYEDINAVSTPSLDGIYRHEVIYSPGAGAGAWAWYVAELGSPPTLIAEHATSGDFSVPGGSKHGMYKAGHGGPSVADPCFPIHGHSYLMDDIADIDDRPGAASGYTGDFLVIHDPGSKVAKMSVTPDCNESGAAPDGNDDLGVGTWERTGDEDTATYGQYRTTNQAITRGGACKVDAPRSLRTGYILAAKGIWRFFNVGGMKGLLGHYDPEAASYTISKTPTLAASVIRYDRLIQHWPTTIGATAPTYRYQAVMGMEHIGLPFGDMRSRVYEAHFGTLQAIPYPLARPSIGHFAADRSWLNQKARPL